MSDLAEWVRVWRNVNIASLAANVPGLLIWLGVLGRILIKRVKLWGLVLICCLMITCQFAYIVLYQVQYSCLHKI
jgi:hypothetical protein